MQFPPRCIHDYHDARKQQETPQKINTKTVAGDKGGLGTSAMTDQPHQIKSTSSLIYCRALPFLAVILSLASPATSFINLNPLKNLLGFETCSSPHVRDVDTAVASLRNSLDADLFGQHLAKHTILTAIKMHLDEASPKKAMVLSLHGWAGSGKTFTTQLIIKSLYEKGEQSEFVKYYSATYHFPDPLKVPEYQKRLQLEVIQTVKKCERALFVFDEVDKLPVGLLDVLIPLIKPIARLEEGVDVKKAIFIFLSNSGANKINDITREAQETGFGRESLALKDFEEILSNEAFEKSGRGGLYMSELIKKILVDWFIPFLPLEREHVMKCIYRDVRNLGGGVGRFKKASIIREEDIEEIANRMTYWPEDKKWFSVTGCKRVEGLVKFHTLSNPPNSGRGVNEL